MAFSHQPPNKQKQPASISDESKSLFSAAMPVVAPILAQNKKWLESLTSTELHSLVKQHPLYITTILPLITERPNQAIDFIHQEFSHFLTRHPKLIEKIAAISAKHSPYLIRIYSLILKNTKQAIVLINHLTNAQEQKQETTPAQQKAYSNPEETDQFSQELAEEFSHELTKSQTLQVQKQSETLLDIKAESASLAAGNTLNKIIESDEYKNIIAQHPNSEVNVIDIIFKLLFNNEMNKRLLNHALLSNDDLMRLIQVVLIYPKFAGEIADTVIMHPALAHNLISALTLLKEHKLEDIYDIDFNQINTADINHQIRKTFRSIYAQTPFKPKISTNLAERIREILGTFVGTIKNPLPNWLRISLAKLREEAYHQTEDDLPDFFTKLGNVFHILNMKEFIEINQPAPSENNWNAKDEIETLDRFLNKVYESFRRVIIHLSQHDRSLRDVFTKHPILTKFDALVQSNTTATYVTTSPDLATDNNIAIMLRHPEKALQILHALCYLSFHNINAGDDAEWLTEFSTSEAEFTLLNRRKKNTLLEFFASTEIFDLPYVSYPLYNPKPKTTPLPCSNAVYLNREIDFDDVTIFQEQKYIPKTQLDLVKMYEKKCRNDFMQFLLQRKEALTDFEFDQKQNEFMRQRPLDAIQKIMDAQNFTEKDEAATEKLLNFLYKAFQRYNPRLIDESNDLSLPALTDSQARDHSKDIRKEIVEDFIQSTKQKREQEIDFAAKEAAERLSNDIFNSEEYLRCIEQHPKNTFEVTEAIKKLFFSNERHKIKFHRPLFSKPETVNTFVSVILTLSQFATTLCDIAIRNAEYSELIVKMLARLRTFNIDSTDNVIAVFQRVDALENFFNIDTPQEIELIRNKKLVSDYLSQSQDSLSENSQVDFENLVIFAEDECVNIDETVKLQEFVKTHSHQYTEEDIFKSICDDFKNKIPATEQKQIEPVVEQKQSRSTEEKTKFSLAANMAFFRAGKHTPEDDWLTWVPAIPDEDDEPKQAKPSGSQTSSETFFSKLTTPELKPPVADEKNVSIGLLHQQLVAAKQKKEEEFKQMVTGNFFSKVPKELHKSILAKRKENDSNNQQKRVSFNI